MREVDWNYFMNRSLREVSERNNCAMYYKELVKWFNSILPIRYFNSYGGLEISLSDFRSYSEVCRFINEKEIFKDVDFDSTSMMDLSELLLKETSSSNKFGHREAYVTNIFKTIIVYFMFTLTEELKEKGVLQI